MTQNASLVAGAAMLGGFSFSIMSASKNEFNVLLLGLCSMFLAVTVIFSTINIMLKYYGAEKTENYEKLRKETNGLTSISTFFFVLGTFVFFISLYYVAAETMMCSKTVDGVVGEDVECDMTYLDIIFFSLWILGVITLIISGYFFYRIIRITDDNIANLANGESQNILPSRDGLAYQSCIKPTR